MTEWNYPMEQEHSRCWWMIETEEPNEGQCHRWFDEGEQRRYSGRLWRCTVVDHALRFPQYIGMHGKTLAVPDRSKESPLLEV